MFHDIHSEGCQYESRAFKNPYNYNGATRCVAVFCFFVFFLRREGGGGGASVFQRNKISYAENMVAGLPLLTSILILFKVNHSQAMALHQFCLDILLADSDTIPSINTFLTTLIQLSCLPRFKYFGLPISVTWSVYRNVNTEEFSLGVGLNKIYISSVRSE